ncbi:MAG: AraC family transcriptional regulator [Bacteroidales bacterium]|nr:AraC family transcriptional regulator [Bacteroidales bacterium]
MKKLLSFITTCVLLLSCCSPAGDTGVAAEETYAPAHIRELAQTDYEAAMKLTTDGLRSGQLSAFTANELRANLTYQYTEDYSSAANYMRKALEQEEARAPGFRSELLYHLATILRNARDYTELLAACTEGKECAHRAGKLFEEYSFDFMAGNGLHDLGEEASLEMMQTAVSKASAIARTESEYGHLLYFSTQYINCLIGEKDYKAALAACASFEGNIGQMENLFPEANHSYIDRFRFYLDVDRAICSSYLGEPEAASKALESALTREYAGTTGGKIRVVDYYAAAGAPDKILALYQGDLPFTGSDTISRDYRFRIARLKEAYANAGIPEKAREYQEIYDTLSKKIEAKEQAEGTKVNAAEYNTQSYRLKLDDTTKVLKRNQRLILALIIVFVLAVAVLLLITLRKARQHSKETRALEKSLGSIRRQVSIIAEKELQKDVPEGREKQQPASLKGLIEGQELYLNKNLNRQSATALLGKTEYEIDKMLDEIAPGISFPDYIKSLRIRHALELLGQNPDIPIAELADRSGFYTLRTFQRSFLAITGKTPSDYAQYLKENK